MEIIAKVSRGSRMDQVYIPKNRAGLPTGSYVVLKPLEALEAKKEKFERPYVYNIKHIEPLKLEIAKDIIVNIDKTIKNENIIITGSFLNKGFHFNDIDIIVITDKRVNINYIIRFLKSHIGINPHILLISNKEIIRGLSKDPLYVVMFSKCIAKKRFLYKIEHKINYKLLDLHLLKSELLIDNFDTLSGTEKYYLTRNMIAISLFLQGKKISAEIVDREIRAKFNFSIDDIKENILEKNSFLRIYKEIYKTTFNKIMNGIKHGSKQK